MNRSIAIKVIAGGVIAAAALASPLFAGGAAGLASANEVRAATYDNMATNRMFDFTATVALPHVNGLLPVADDSGFTSVYLRGKALDTADQLRPGDKVRLKGGVSHSNLNGNNYAQAFTSELLEHGKAPEPIHASLAEINSEGFRNRVVTLKGLIADVFRDEIDPRFMFIVLSDDTSCAFLPVQGRPGDPLPAHLVGATVEVVGVVSIPRANTLNRKVQNVTVLISNLDSIKIRKAAPDDPFDVPALYKDGVNMWGFLKSGLRRRRVAGRVLAVWRDKALVKTSEGLVSRVQFAERPFPICGSSIEAAGIPDTDFFRLNLSRAIWRESAAKDDSPKPDAETTTAEVLLRDTMGNAKISAAHYGRLVTVSGTLSAKPSTSLRDMCAELVSNDLRLVLDLTSAPHALDDIDTGSTIEVTGIYVIEAEAWRPQTPYPHIQDTFIAVRSPADIRVTERPPWWTTGRLVAVIFALLIVLAGIIAWNLTLDRLARRRGLLLAREQVAHEKAALKAEERTRLAVELHDTLAQNLTGVAMEIETASKLRGDAPPEMIAHIEIAGKALKSCRDEIKSCIWDLRSQALEAPDMAKAIAKTLQPYAKSARIDIRFDVPMSRFSDNAAHAILRIVRELVANATRHGCATSIAVDGSATDAGIRFSVADNGCGFDPESVPGVSTGHFGLQGIRERVAELKGQLSIKSAHGQGTTATITMTTGN